MPLSWQRNLFWCSQEHKQFAFPSWEEGQDGVRVCQEWNNPSSFLPSGWKDELLCHFRGKGIYSGVRKNTRDFPFRLKGKVRMGFVYVRNWITHPHSFPQDGRMNLLCHFRGEGIYSGVRKNTNNLPFHHEGKVRMGFVYVRNGITHPHSFPRDGRMNL